MLSILIPTYNFDVKDLVKDLYEQCSKLTFEFEIIVLEDASKTEYSNINKDVIRLGNQIKHECLDTNIGRSKIRNLLVKKAKYDYLLFMDCDSKVVHSNYINNYFSNLQPDQLLYGGRTYSTQKPNNQSFILHWKFGTHREQSSAIERSQKPYDSFMTNNFVIPKAIFQTIQFDETLLQYGHEDTLFGLELKAKSIPILHIDNPLEHIGLEENHIFLKKSEQAIENLVQLLQAGKPIKTKLITSYKILKILKLNRIFLFLFKQTEGFLIKKLCTANPSLFYFDCYKLGKFCQKMSSFS